MRPLAGKVALVTGFILVIFIFFCCFVFHKKISFLLKEQQEESEKVLFNDYEYYL